MEEDSTATITEEVTTVIVVALPEITTTKGMKTAKVADNSLNLIIIG